METAITHSYSSLDESPHTAARRVALAYGPSPLECAELDGLRYGPSVLARSLANPPGDWDQRVRLYSDGLLRGEWTPTFSKSHNSGPQELSTQGALKPRVSSQDDHWQFHCPVSIIFGLQDVALDPRVVLDGIETHFVAGSNDPLVSTAMAEARITRLKNCGHWSVLEEEGYQALDRVLGRIID